jgi:anti-anti-sigma factor
VPDSLDLPGSIESRSVLLPDLVCTCRISGRDSVWVHVSGTLNRGTASCLEHTLRRLDLRLGMIVLDLRGLTFIDLAGVRVIVDASIEAWLGDRRLLLVRGPSHVDRVFVDAEVSDVVEIGDLHSPQGRPAAPSVRGRGPAGMDGAAPPIERVQRDSIRST